MGVIKKFIQLPPGQKRMIPEAIWLSAWYRFQVLYRPFAKLSPKIGTLGQETPWENEDRRTAAQVRSMVEAVSHRMPWTCNCLNQALTAKKMLQRRGLCSTLYMGVAPTEDGQMAAHAWLRCGSLYVTGRSGMQNFTVTTIYGGSHPHRNEGL